MFPKDHLLDPAIDYASLDYEMVACCPMILSTNAGPRNADSCNAINSREFTKMFRQDIQIVYRDLSHMLGHLSFWVHERMLPRLRMVSSLTGVSTSRFLGLPLLLFVMLPVIVRYRP